MADRYSYNGNDPARHRDFLRALREVPGWRSFDRFRPGYASGERLRVPLEVFLENLRLDATTRIDFTDADFIRVETTFASDPTNPNVVWEFHYDAPWTQGTKERIDALRREHYGK